MPQTQNNLHLPPGEVLKEQYQIVDTVALNPTHGIYKAIDLSDHSPVALKILASNVNLAGRQWEAILQTLESIRAIRRTGLVTVFDLFHDRVGAAFVEEWLRGASLLTVLRARPLTPIDVLTVLSSLARGLDYLLAHRLPSFPFNITDLVIAAPSAPGEEWIHQPLKSWQAFELKIDPLPLTDTRRSTGADPFVSSFTATLYQMLGGRPTGGSTGAGFRPLVSLEETGNQVLRRYVEGRVQAKSCEEILAKLAEAESIEPEQFQPSPIPHDSGRPSAAPPILPSHYSTSSKGPVSSTADSAILSETENTIASKEAEIHELQIALERRMEEKRLAEIRSKLEKSFEELEEERTRFQEQVAAERDRLSDEGARLQTERDRLATEKARQEELSTRLANLQEDFESEKTAARDELEKRREALDKRQEELQQRVGELRTRESSIKEQRAAIEAKEAVLASQSAELSSQQREREADLARNAARVEADRQEVERSRRLLVSDQAVIEQQRKEIADHREEIAGLDQTLTNRQELLAEREQAILTEREQVELSQRQLEAQRQSFDSESSDLERRLSDKQLELEKLRLVSDRSAAQQSELDDLEIAKREIETQRADLLERQEELKRQNEKQANRLEELMQQHEQDITRRRRELSEERDRYESLIEQLSRREEEFKTRAHKQQQAQDQLNEARANLEAREKETETLRTELERLKAEQTRQQSERDHFQSEIAGLQDTIGQLEAERSRTLEEQATQESALAQVEIDQSEIESRLKEEFRRREQLLEQQKAAAERQLRKSEERVGQLQEQEIAIQEREQQIHQREALAGELEETAKRERAARQEEAKRRAAAEKRSRTLWTKTAIAASVAALILAGLGWAWIKQGGGSIIREKQLILELTGLQKESDNNALRVLNRVNAFIDDGANEGKDYTLDSGFSQQLRQVLEESMKRLEEGEASSLTSYAAMLRTVEADSEIESPRHFLSSLGKSVGLFREAENLKQQLDQLHRQLSIAEEADPFRKVFEVVKYREAFPEDTAAMDAFSGALRVALDSVAPLDNAAVSRAWTVLEGVDMKQLPEPGPFLGLVVAALSLGDIAQNGLTTREINSAAGVISSLLETEVKQANLQDREARQDHALTFRLLNRVSGSLRDGYRALQPDIIDQDTHEEATRIMLPVIDNWSGSLARLGQSNRPELVEFLSLIADTTTDGRLLKALLSPAYPIPAVRFKNLELGWKTQAPFSALEEIATQMIESGATTTIAHQRSASEWDSYVRSIRTYAHYSMARIRISMGSLQGPEGLSSIREGEQHLVQGLRLQSRLTYATIVQMLPFCSNALQGKGARLSAAAISEVENIVRAARLRVSEQARNSFSQALSPAEEEALAWLFQSGEAESREYPHLFASARYLLSKRIAPLDQVAEETLTKLEALLRAGADTAP